jgi:hypothetical protein
MLKQRIHSFNALARACSSQTAELDRLRAKVTRLEREFSALQASMNGDAWEFSANNPLEFDLVPYVDPQSLTSRNAGRGFEHLDPFATSMGSHIPRSSPWSAFLSETICVERTDVVRVEAP